MQASRQPEKSTSIKSRLLIAGILSLSVGLSQMLNPAAAANLATGIAQRETILVASKETESSKDSSKESSKESSKSESSNKSEDKEKRSKDEGKKSKEEEKKSKDTSKSKDEKSKDSKSKDEKSSKDDKSKDEKSKGGKSDKSDKSDKTDKSKKSEKSDKDADSEDKKKTAKHGFFGRKDKVESKAESKKEEKVETAEETKKETQKSEAKEKTAEKPAIVFAPDVALISVIKDLSRSLKESESVKAITDENEKYIIELAQQILDKAVADPALTANRIVQEEGKKSGPSLTAEAWSSGDIEVSDKFHGAISAIWAKRVGGLLTLTIAGDCRDKKSPSGKPVNEFLVVIEARSPVETGFDIQSQSNVSFWLGRLSKIAVESDCVERAEPESSENKENTQASETEKPGVDASKKKSIVLPPLLTNRYRKHFELLIAASEKERSLAIALAEPPLAVEAKVKPSTKKAAAKTEEKEEAVEEESDANEQSEVKNKKGEKEKESVKAASQKDESAESKEESAEANKTARAERAGTKTNSESAEEPKQQKAESKAEGKVENRAESKVENKGESKVEKIAAATNSGSAPPTVEKYTARANDNLPQLRYPKENSKLLMPERVLAGQYLTVALLDDRKQPEPFVELSFNGMSLKTDANGQASFMVPEDTTPGRSLNVQLSARADEMPLLLEVLQPLTLSDEPQNPKLDRTTPLAASHSTLVLDGHNFDGLAQGNRVIIDGVHEGVIIASSPVQLKVNLPGALNPGIHTVCVSTKGMRSNPVCFEYVCAELVCDAKDPSKDNSNKVVVKVLGTVSKVPVKLVNRTPDLIRLASGNETKQVSTGGADNNISLTVQRLKKGAVKMETQIEL